MKKIMNAALRNAIAGTQESTTPETTTESTRTTPPTGATPEQVTSTTDKSCTNGTVATPDTTGTTTATKTTGNTEAPTSTTTPFANDETGTGETLVDAETETLPPTTTNQTKFEYVDGGTFLANQPVKRTTESEAATSTSKGGRTTSDPVRTTEGTEDEDDPATPTKVDRIVDGVEKIVVLTNGSNLLKRVAILTTVISITIALISLPTSISG